MPAGPSCRGIVLCNGLSQVGRVRRGYQQVARLNGVFDRYRAYAVFGGEFFSGGCRWLNLIFLHVLICPCTPLRFIRPVIPAAQQ